MSWTGRLSPTDLQRRTRELLDAGHLEGERAIFAHDLDRMEARIAALHAAFPQRALHAVAVKANPVVGVLEAAVAAGAGLECASIEEVELSLAAGCSPERIVFDSPAKTLGELEESLERGLHLNVDNLDELERVASLIEGSGGPVGHVGIRVNPQIGSGSIALTSVAGRVSKFGVPLTSGRARLLDAFARYRWLDGLHVHVGSQGCDLEQLVVAVERVLDLRDEAEARRDEPITQVDIGGGLPVRYRDEDDPPELADYVTMLRERAPGAFRADTRIVTEFGRSIQAGCGWAVSRVEYVKEEEGRSMAVLHVGGDAFMRPVYAPNDWHHDFLVLDGEGRLKDGPSRPISLVGPLCFGGDILARDRPLPLVEAGDLVVVRDSGAYTLSTWSRHCSRGLPRVVGWREGGSAVLKECEGREDVVDFWS